MVIFAIYTLAQTYRVGIANRGEGTDLDALAKNAAVSRKHQIGLPLESVDESQVNTQFGEASLRVYSIRGAGWIRRGTRGRNHGSTTVTLRFS